MFSISYKNKCVFWHIHKNAGSYIEFILRDYYKFDDYDHTSIINNFKNNFEDNKINEQEKKSICECSKYIDEYGLMGYIIKANPFIFDTLKYDFSDYTIFSVIRNPYDRAISSYEFIKNKKFDSRLTEKFDNVSFKDFFKNYKKYSENIFMLTHAFLSQYDNIKNNFNNIKVNYFCDYTDINKELVDIFKKINLDDPYKYIELIKNNLKMNCSKKKEITSYYCQESLELINQIFIDDFKYFKFKIYTNVDELNLFLIDYNNSLNRSDEKIIKDQSR